MTGNPGVAFAHETLSCWPIDRKEAEIRALQTGRAVHDLEPNISGIQATIKSGTNPNATNEIGGTPLHYAVISGQPAAVGALLACGAEPGKGDEALCTPLHLAAMMGNISIIKKLLEAGATPNVRDSNGVCPLHGAAMKGRTGAVDALLTGGADPSIPDLDGYTPLHLARKYDHKDTQKRLERVEKPALTKTKTKQEIKTAMFAANTVESVLLPTGPARFVVTSSALPAVGAVRGK